MPQQAHCEDVYTYCFVLFCFVLLLQEATQTIMSWFSSSVYQRYWQHYQQAAAWQQRHRRAYRKASEAAFGPGYCPERYADWNAEPSDGDEGEDTEDNEQSSSDSEIECDVSNVEISDELRQYFAQTEKHREELSKAPNGDAQFRPVCHVTC